MQVWWSQTLLTGTQWQSKRQHAQTEIETLLKQKKKFFFFQHEGGQVLGNIAQGGCRVSILREVQNMTGHDPRHCPNSTLSRKVVPDSFQTPLPTSAVLWTLNSSPEQHVHNTHGEDAWKFGIYFLLIHKEQTDPFVKILYCTFLHGLYKIASLTQIYLLN